MLAAASKKSGITNLQQIKDRIQQTWIVGNNAIILNYYGIKPEDLRAHGGCMMPDNATRENRASGDVFIGSGLLANTPEQRSWYEASQLNDLVYRRIGSPSKTGSPLKNGGANASPSKTGEPTRIRIPFGTDLVFQETPAWVKDDKSFLKYLSHHDQRSVIDSEGGRYR